MRNLSTILTDHNTSLLDMFSKAFCMFFSLSQNLKKKLMDFHIAGIYTEGNKAS